VIAALFHPVALLLATICLQWVVLASLGAFTVKLPYFALALIIAYAAVDSRRVTACLLFVRHNAAWILAFILYAILLTASVFGSPAQNAGFRQLFYLTGCIAIAGSLAAARNVNAVLRMGAGLAIVLFILVVEISARKIGLSWVDAVGEFLSSGDLRFVVYSFFREVFNSADPSDDVNFMTSLKNAIAVCVLICGLLFRCASTRPWRDFTGMAFLALVAFLLLMLNTRSVIIVGALSVLLAIGLRVVAGRGHSLPFVAMKGLATIAAAAIFFVMSEPSPVSDLMADRFAFDDTSTESRVVQADFALARIAEHPLVGSGFQKVGGYQVHNLFLNAWMNAGIAAFLLVVAFYLLLIGRWVSFVWMLVRSPERWVLPLAPEWVAPLPLLPFFRVWLSGDGGNLFLGEWIAVAAFLGLILANDLRRAATGAVETAPAVEQPPLFRPQRAVRQPAPKRARLR
jgi:O-antigen ligase